MVFSICRRALSGSIVGLAALVCQAAFPSAKASAQGLEPILATFARPQPNQTSAEFGKAVTFLNGHIVVGAPREGLVGAVEFFDGASYAPAHTLFGLGLDGFGEYLHNVGLAYGRDRIQDLILGGPHVQGALFALKGAGATYIEETSAVPLLVPFQPAQFGSAAAVIGDVDGDSLQDYVVGAPTYTVPGEIYPRGAAFVISGKTASVLSTIVGSLAFGRFGESVAAVGDYDGDGKGDVAIGAPDTSNLAGTVSIYGSALSFTLPYVQFNGIAQSGSIQRERLGTRLVASDIDCDGVKDLVTGSYRADIAPFDSAEDGVIRAFRGSALRIGQVSEIFARSGSQNSQLGLRLVTVPDINGDRRDDLVTVQWMTGGPQALVAVRVLSGGNGTEIGAHVLPAALDTTRQVPSLAAGPDKNSDGYGDILLGRPGLDSAELLNGSFFAAQAHETAMQACP
jgi:hypothetical protein